MTGGTQKTDTGPDALCLTEKTGCLGYAIGNALPFAINPAKWRGGGHFQRISQSGQNLGITIPIFSAASGQARPVVGKAQRWLYSYPSMSELAQASYSHRMMSKKKTQLVLRPKPNYEPTKGSASSFQIPPGVQMMH